MAAGQDAAAARYPVLLAILLKLSTPTASDQLRAFLRAQPSATAVPFISWVADLQATASGERRRALGALCERLVAAREAAEAEAMENMYAQSLRVLSGGDGKEESLVATDPSQYASRLAEALTGGPVLREGYGAAYDALLQVAQTPALTPEGVAKAHAEAAELAEDMRARRRRSFAAVVGRLPITSPEQEQQLLGPSAASRILELLLCLPSEEEREALLPDCFTPPPPEEEPGGAGAGGSSAAARSGPGAGGEETDEIWCMPLQLLNEVDSRLREVAGASGERNGSSDGRSNSGAGLPLPRGPQQRMIAGGHGLSGDAYVAALRHLRETVAAQWLQGLPGNRAPADGPAEGTEAGGGSP